MEKKKVDGGGMSGKTVDDGSAVRPVIHHLMMSFLSIKCRMILLWKSSIERRSKNKRERQARDQERQCDQKVIASYGRLVTGLGRLRRNPKGNCFPPRFWKPNGDQDKVDARPRLAASAASTVLVGYGLILLAKVPKEENTENPGGKWDSPSTLPKNDNDWNIGESPFVLIINALVRWLPALRSWCLELYNPPRGAFPGNRAIQQDGDGDADGSLRTGSSACFCSACTHLELRVGQHTRPCQFNGGPSIQKDPRIQGNPPVGLLLGGFIDCGGGVGVRRACRWNYTTPSPPKPVRGLGVGCDPMRNYLCNDGGGTYYTRCLPQEVIATTLNPEFGRRRVFDKGSQITLSTVHTHHPEDTGQEANRSTSTA
ncbi:hypothetical protein QBC35DRAFT_472210 [Podospora australis]|uniref:Uncharacterized protein n=1 Tax=Podospora australis TaxID=1536484 RepID=A0AAN6WXF9_9PEZI|nr:hypothetical protein QBC35DRAFT_472210 [Podospora australis]